MRDWPKVACSVTGHGKDVKDYSGFEKKRGHEPSNVGGLEKLERARKQAHPGDSRELCTPADRHLKASL